MKTKEFKDIISQNAAKANGLIINIIKYSCIPFSSWFETHSRLNHKQAPAGCHSPRGRLIYVISVRTGIRESLTMPASSPRM